MKDAIARYILVYMDGPKSGSWGLKTKEDHFISRGGFHDLIVKRDDRLFKGKSQGDALSKSCRDPVYGLP
jgi:hypothetical protein